MLNDKKKHINYLKLSVGEILDQEDFKQFLIIIFVASSPPQDCLVESEFPTKRVSHLFGFGRQDLLVFLIA